MNKQGCRPGTLFIEGTCRKQGYNSQGKWSSLWRTQRFEEELLNPFPKDIGLPKETPVIWITLNRRNCLHYVVPLEEWEKIERGEKFDKDLLYCMETIKFKKGDKVIHTDGEGGYLIARPSSKI